MAALMCLRFPLPDWFSQCTSNGPSQVQSIFDLGRRHSHTLCPFSNTQARALKVQKSCISSIASLLFPRCPPAVLGRVIAVVVYAFKLIFPRRAYSHVFKKSWKGFAPLLANQDAATAVSRIANVIRCLAATDHRSPAFVSNAVTHSMCCASSYCCLSPEASAAFLYPASKTRSVSTCHVSARASTRPDYQLIVVPPRKFGDGKSVKCQTDKVSRVVKLGGIFGLRRIDNWHCVVRHNPPPFCCCSTLRTRYSQWLVDKI